MKNSVFIHISNNQITNKKLIRQAFEVLKDGRYEEEWKDITGFEGLYQISSHGRVKSYPKTVKLGNGGMNYFPGRIMKPEVMKLGYIRAQLNNNGVRKRVLVHILVASHFVENPQLGKEVNHKDGNKANNHFRNLEWLSKSENVKHSYDVIGRKKAFHKKRAVNMISLSGIVIKTFPSINDAASKTGISTGNIHGACNGRYKFFKGYKWSYA